MFSFSIWSIIRIIFSLVFTIGFAYLGNYIRAIEAKECPLSTGWRITNGKLLSSIFMLVGAVNVFCPASKFLSTLPIIGSSYVLLFVVGVFLTFFIVNRLAINILEVENRRCKVEGYNSLTKYLSNQGVSECIYYTIVISILFFYL